MTDIRFYQLQTQSLEIALPQLLGKALDNKHRVLVRVKDSKEAERLNTMLWSYKKDSFLPHGTKKTGYEADQPIFISEEQDNPNKADTLFIIESDKTEDLSNFKLCCEIFDGKNDEAVKAARSKWKSYKDDGHNITYWQQTAKGSWEDKTNPS